jgi:hypothetical protein
MASRRRSAKTKMLLAPLLTEKGQNYTMRIYECRGEINVLMVLQKKNYTLNASGPVDFRVGPEFDLMMKEMADSGLDIEQLHFCNGENETFIDVILPYVPLFRTVRRLYSSLPDISSDQSRSVLIQHGRLTKIYGVFGSDTSKTYTEWTGCSIVTHLPLIETLLTPTTIKRIKCSSGFKGIPKELVRRMIYYLTGRGL